MPKRVDHTERRREISDALLRAARSRGLHMTGFREIAAEAGVSVRLTQYYFGSKEKLLLSGLQRVGELIAERISTRLADLAPEATSRDRVETILTAMLPADTLTRDLYTVHAAYAALSLTDPTLAAQPYGAGSDNLQAEIARIVRSAQELHEISPGRNPENVALTLLAMTTGLAAAIIANHQPLQAATSALRDHLDSLFTTTRPAALGANPTHRRSAG